MTPIARAHPVGIGDDVVAGDADLAGVGRDQRGQDLHHRGLAGAVGAEQGEDRALGHGRDRCRRAPSSPPNDLHSPAAVIAGALLMTVLVSLAGLVRGARPRRAARRDGLSTPPAAAAIRSIRKSANAAISSSIARRCDGGARDHLQALPRQVAELLVLGDVEPLACGDDRSRRTRSIRSPAARVRRIACMASSTFTAPVIALRLASSASASSPMLCSGGSQTARYPSSRPTIGGNA